MGLGVYPALELLLCSVDCELQCSLMTGLCWVVDVITTCTKTVLTILKSTYCNNPMGWAEWMIVNQSLEEELELERTFEMFKAALP